MEDEEKRTVDTGGEKADLVDFDKMYFYELHKMTKTMGKTTLLVLLGVAMSTIMFSGIQWWAKGIFGLGGLILVAFVYYDVKYMLGLKKSPFMIFPEKKTFRYYNEFEGNKEIDIMQIKEIKVYSRVKPKETFLWEVFLHNQKKEENVNVSGYGDVTLEELMYDIRQFNPNIDITANREVKNKGKK